MDKEKQIEEMAKYTCYPCEMHVGDGVCAVCNDYRTCRLSLTTAVNLYNAGYRKQSEVTKEIFDEIEHSFSELRKIEYAHPILQHMFDVLDDLKKKYTDGERRNKNGAALGKHSGVADEIIDMLISEPPADVQEVRHGHWYWYEESHSFYMDDFECGWKCSCCNSYPDHDNYMADDYENKPNLEYCPHCGAKMDGKEN